MGQRIKDSCDHYCQDSPQRINFYRANAILYECRRCYYWPTMGAGIGSEFDFKSLLITDNIGSFTYNITCRNFNCFILATNPIKSTSPVNPVLDTSQWNAWEACAPCPTGTRQRYRPCLAEYPQFGLTLHHWTNSRNNNVCL